MKPITVLNEAYSVEFCDQLISAWRNEHTFVVLPSRSRLTEEDVVQRFKQLSQQQVQKYATQHFGLLTSGSTGTPDLLLGSRKRATQMVTVLHQVQESEDVRETIVVLPLAYCYSFVNQWLWSYVFERPIRWTGGFSFPDVVLDALRKANNAMLCMVGSQVSLLFSRLQSEVFPGVIRIHFAGGRFPQESTAQLSFHFPNAKIFSNYGCVEAMPRLAIRSAGSASDSAVIGAPIPGVLLRVDAFNEISFRSPFSAVARLREHSVHEYGMDEWISTGDVGHVNTHGHWELMGRKGEVFKRFGEKVSVAQVFSMISAVSSVPLCSYREKDTFGEDGYVIVLEATPMASDTVKTILELLRDGLPRAQWPLRIESIAEIPCLPNGKYDLQALVEAGPKRTMWRQRLGGHILTST